MPGTYVEKILLFPKGKSGFQQEVFPEMGSHHLKAHGKFHAAFPDGSAGNGHGGEAGQVGGDRVDVRQIGLKVIQRGISDFGSGSGRYNQGKDEWQHVVKNAMASNYSWESSAREYIKLYESMRDGE